MSLIQKLKKRAAESRPVRVAVIGAGKFGSMYLSQAPRTPGIHLVAVADLSPDRARASLTRVGWEASRFAATSLAQAAPEIPFMGEEQGGEEAGRARWVLDPIDGTINFARDSPLCAISLSLVVGGQPVLGIVDAPLLGERFIARQGEVGTGFFLVASGAARVVRDGATIARIGPGDSHQPNLAVGGRSKVRKAMFSATLMWG